MCDGHAGTYWRTWWPSCPVRVLRQDHRLLVAVHLVRDLEHSPLAGWPVSWAAWVPALVDQLQRAKRARMLADQERALAAAAVPGRAAQVPYGPRPR